VAVSADSNPPHTPPSYRSETGFRDWCNRPCVMTEPNQPCIVHPGLLYQSLSKLYISSLKGKQENRRFLTPLKVSHSAFLRLPGFQSLALPNCCPVTLFKYRSPSCFQIYFLIISLNNSVHLSSKKFTSADIYFIVKAIYITAFQAQKVTFSFLRKKKPLLG